MPYSHLPPMSRERLDSSAQLRMSNCLDNLASVPDNEFVELVCENGQILMQGQSFKTRKSSPKNDFQSYVYKSQEGDEEDAVIPKFERAGNGGSVLNDFSSSGPSGQMGMGQDDELVRWLNYPLDDYSEFFSELSGVNQNALSAQHNAPPQGGRNSNYDQVVRESCRGFTYGGVNSEQGNASKVVEESPDLTRARGSNMCSPSLQQCQPSLPSHRSRDSNQTPTSANGNPNTKIQKQGNKPTKPPQHPSNNTGFMNFSHFLRPATLAKGNQQSVATTASSDLPSMDRIRSNSKVSVASNSNPIESTVVESNSVSRSIAGCQSQLNSLPGKMDVKSSMHKATKDAVFSEQSETICREDTLRKSRSSDQTLGQSSGFAASTATGTGRPDSDTGIEPVVASSSVCSGNSTGDASNDPKRVLKRKSRDTAESEYPSEDIEEESVGARKPTSARGGTGTKRSRAAEVHNLSERRRRDRINEKMRALQELIPNCNKVDKASMLDEAIEYLKTLQLQVQIMSMGIGLYMPPMMLPTGMQHMHAPNMASFSPMSVGMGMGMGMGFGMGMLNVSGSPSVCPLIQMPPMHGTHFSCPPHSGPSSMPKMTGPNHPMFGLPGQGQPMSMPPTPYVPISGGSSANPVLLPVSNVATSMEGPKSIAPSHLKDPTGNMKTKMLKPDAESDIYAGPGSRSS